MHERQNTKSAEVGVGLDKYDEQVTSFADGVMLETCDEAEVEKMSYSRTRLVFSFVSLHNPSRSRY